METTKQFTKEEFQSRLEGYVEVVKNLVAENYKDISYERSTSVEVEDGRRYAKVIVSGNGVHTFIDKTNGDILKAATYQAPAKNGVRGNIFSEDFGASKVDWHGARYLR